METHLPNAVISEGAPFPSPFPPLPLLWPLASSNYLLGAAYSFPIYACHGNAYASLN